MQHHQVADLYLRPRPVQMFNHTHPPPSFPPSVYATCSPLAFPVRLTFYSSKMRLLLGWLVLVATLGVLRAAPEDQATGISEDTLKRESARRNLRAAFAYCAASIPLVDACLLKLFFFPASLRVVPEWGETGGRGSEESSVRREADEGGDVEERAEAPTPHEVPPKQH